MSLEDILFESRVKDIKDFRSDCYFFDIFFISGKYVSDLEITPLPFQNKKMFSRFDKKFWPNFYKKHLEYIASYYYLCYPRVICNNKNKNKKISRKQMNNLHFDEFHFLCKLKNNMWMYLFQYSDMTDNFTWGADECHIYVDPDIIFLIKYGVAVKNYEKIGIKLKSPQNQIVQNIMPETVFDSEMCPICLENDNLNKSNNFYLNCGHNLCKKCIRRLLQKNNEFIKCPLCNKHTDREYFSQPPDHDIIQEFVKLCK